MSKRRLIWRTGEVPASSKPIWSGQIGSMAWTGTRAPVSFVERFQRINRRFFEMQACQPIQNRVGEFPRILGEDHPLALQGEGRELFQCPGFDEGSIEGRLPVERGNSGGISEPVATKRSFWRLGEER